MWPSGLEFSQNDQTGSDWPRGVSTKPPKVLGHCNMPVSPPQGARIGVEGSIIRCGPNITCFAPRRRKACYLETPSWYVPLIVRGETQSNEPLPMRVVKAEKLDLNGGLHRWEKKHQKQQFWEI